MEMPGLSALHRWRHDGQEKKRIGTVRGRVPALLHGGSDAVSAVLHVHAGEGGNPINRGEADFWILDAIRRGRRVDGSSEVNVTVTK